MNWWMLAALVVLDVYVISFAIVAWAITGAPVVPDSQLLLDS